MKEGFAHISASGFKAGFSLTNLYLIPPQPKIVYVACDASSAPSDVDILWHRVVRGLAKSFLAGINGFAGT